MKQGRNNLEGNQSNKFLKKVDNLELAFQREDGEVIFRGAPYVSTLRSYLKVQDTCMGKELKPGYKDAISLFNDQNRSMSDTTVSPKVHMVMDHLIDFFTIKGEDHGMLK